MNRVKHIDIDLNAFKIILRFENSKDPLILHFDTPSRKFYFALIALIVHEMKYRDATSHVYIRKYENQLKYLDNALAGVHASGSIDGMWEKIRKSWNYSLPNLEEAAHFKIEGRDLKPPYEKGGKYVYECTEYESDTWADLFAIDVVNNKWKFRFALDNTGVSSPNVSLKYEALKDDLAWKVFLRNIDETSLVVLPSDDLKSKKIDRTLKRHRSFFASTIVFAVILMVGGATLVNRYLQPGPGQVAESTAPKASIAVLPFLNISDESDKDYYCDGITEELISNLGQIKDLKVISRTSAFYFKDKDVDLKTIGKRLNVDHILEGSVRVSNDDLRITAQLINVKDNSHIWAETYDRKVKDIFNTQASLANEIACSLKSRFGCEEQAGIAKRHTENFEAYRYYLMGRHFWNESTRKGNQKALTYYKKAIALDPGFALAYVGMSDIYQQLAFSRPVSREETYKLAKQMALKALEIDDNLAEAYASLGFLNTRFEWGWENAEANFKKSIELNPNYSLAARYYSSYLRAVGRLDEAIEETKRGLALDPFSTHLNRHLGIVYRFAGLTDKAIDHFKKTLELDPDNPQALSMISNCYMDKGMHEKAIVRLQKALSISPNHPFVLGNLGKAYAGSGNNEEAHKILNQLLERSKKKYFPPIMIANLYMSLGLKDEAFDWLEKGYTSKDTLMFCLKTIPNWKPVHSDPRWSQLMKKMGLDGYPVM